MAVHGSSDLDSPRVAMLYNVIALLAFCLLCLAQLLFYGADTILSYDMFPAFAVVRSSCVNFSFCLLSCSRFPLPFSRPQTGSVSVNTHAEPALDGRSGGEPDKEKKPQALFCNQGLMYRAQFSVGFDPQRTAGQALPQQQCFRGG